MRKMREYAYNDIRLMPDLDHDILKHDIGMNALHIKFVIRHVQRLKTDHECFTNWLRSLQMTKEIVESLEQCGIMTLDALQYWCGDDMNAMMHCVGGAQYKEHAEVIWARMPRSGGNTATVSVDWTPSPLFVPVLSLAAAGVHPGADAGCASEGAVMEVERSETRYGY